MKAFICCAGQDSRFVCSVVSYLKPHFTELYFYLQHQRADQNFDMTIDYNIRDSEAMLIFVGNIFTPWQSDEVGMAMQEEGNKNFIIICIGGQQEINQLPPNFPRRITRRVFLPDEYTRNERPEVAKCAYDIVSKLGLPWEATALPVNPHLFTYEKEMIKFYLTKHEVDIAREPTSDEERGIHRYIAEKLQDGCPDSWPEVRQWKGENKNPLDDIGEFRSDDATVVAAALSTYKPGQYGLHFKEAGPREFLHFPRRSRVAQRLRVAVLVSGGIAPGINAVIDGIVQRHWKYRAASPRLEIWGIRNGFYGFDDLSYSLLCPDADDRYARGGHHTIETAERANDGGSMLGTSRVDDLINFETRRAKLETIAAALLDNRIDILYIIGGDGSMKAAHALWHVADSLAGQRQERGLKDVMPVSVVAIPKTMDNDILWVWQSFGFLSAVQKAREIVNSLYIESSSNPRLGVLQLFGSDSGFVVSYAVLASATGQCNLALIPEVEFSMIGIARHLKKVMCSRNAQEYIPHALVVMAETAIPMDVLECLGDQISTLPEYAPLYREIAAHLSLSEDEKAAIRKFNTNRKSGHRIEGQTNDHLREAGLRIMMQALPILIKGIRLQGPPEPDWDKLRVFSNEPRHLLRAIAPETSDVIMARRLGTLAVDNAMAGYTDFMISQWLTEFVLVPLELVVLGRKRIPEYGIFWKSIQDKTGQGDLVSPWKPPSA